MPTCEPAGRTRRSPTPTGRRSRSSSTTSRARPSTPLWLYGMLPHQMIFSTWDDLYAYLRHIAHDPVIDRLNRWYFFDLSHTERTMKPDTSTPKRSIAKGRLLGNLLESRVLRTGLRHVRQPWRCAVFTGLCFVVKLILFYYHERIWHQIPLGKEAMKLQPIRREKCPAATRSARAAAARRPRMLSGQD